ncbi:hypothetical protein [Brevundimonas sp.]|uniref:hypothetical protein n=1 Tax=Brevundimonas sp. TaxID=1871086 RepID=UPI002897B862|nr:hypothetical protein [Brevundimonas sp.]
MTDAVKTPDPRRGMPSPELSRGDFTARFLSAYQDPAFDAGYFEPYATSHDALDRDKDIQAEVRIAAEELARAMQARRDGRLASTGEGLEGPRQK